MMRYSRFSDGVTLMAVTCHGRYTPAAVTPQVLSRLLEADACDGTFRVLTRAQLDIAERQVRTQCVTDVTRVRGMVTDINAVQGWLQTLTRYRDGCRRYTRPRAR